MAPDSRSTPYWERGSQVLWKDEQRIYRRGWRATDHGKQWAALFVVPAAEHASPSNLDQLRHEYELKDELDGDWAVRPRELIREGGRTVLVLEDPGGEPLNRLLGAPLEIGCFLRLGIAIATAVGKAHQRGLVHRDIKPTNILANDATGEVHLTGFGIASRLARERQSPHPPETLAGTLAYMAPEQTGRMNRSVDSRSDLYALGVMLYQMLTGALPFIATEPMEWVHCHLAKRPVPPAERLNEIPAAVSLIVMKMLAKRAEERYQTANGLERDLRRCQHEWEAQRRIDAFALGEHDSSDRLLIPEKLYGRERQVEMLLAAFDRVVKGGAPELVLVSGYSGIGKSSVVNELQPVLVPPRGLFASGKFDQYKRDIPYSTLAQAFRSLVQPLLGKSEVDLAPWRDGLQEALGANAGLIVDLVPEVKLIIGDPPPVPELPPQDAQRRFQLVFRRFIGVFADPKHPLALFIDDLQWLDAATLDLLEDLLIRSELRHFLLIGAYRDNEVDATHPLMRKLEAIRNTGGRVQEFALAPLTRDHLGQLIGDGFHCKPERSSPLAQLVHEKTGGNPFFVIQFIHSLAEQRMLGFDHDSAEWSWDLERIRAKAYTDNVVELMVGRFSRLPVETQAALQHLACLGNVAELMLLAIALESSEEQIHAFLRPALRLELVVRLEGAYKFTHDRVQEAAYSLIPQALRAQTHLRIGRLLAANIAPKKLDEAVFEIVGQLNRGVTLVVLREEREQLARLNLIAGKRAKLSTAYVSALKYLIAGATILTADAWERCRDLIFTLELERAECEFLTGELESAEHRLTRLSERTADITERAQLVCLHMGACTELLRFDRACAVALDFFRQIGLEILPHPTEDDVRLEYERTSSQLSGRTVEEVVHSPLMSNPVSLAAVDVLNSMMVPAGLTDQNLSCVAQCRAVNLSLVHGNCDASCIAYVMLGRVAIERFRDYKTAFRFGQIGLELVDGRGLKRFQARAYVCFAYFIAPWMKHARTSIDLARRSYDAATKIGDFTFANYSNLLLTTYSFIVGEPLNELQCAADRAFQFAKQSRFGGVIDQTNFPLALVRTLRGLTPKFGCFDSEVMQELPFERHLADSPSLRIHECFYWIRKMQARYFAGDYAAAIEASANAHRLLWIAPGHIEEAEYHFYGGLCSAAYCDSVTADERRHHLTALSGHHRQLEIWAKICPDNFENRAALIGAEIARIESRDVEAMRLYENAIRSSRASGFIHNEALAYERASVFYRARGLEQFADTYLRSARGCYASWGAEGKVRQLDQLYPGLEQQQPSPGPAATISTPIEGLDLATVIRVSQSVSSEIVLEKLLDIVMRNAIEHAGAERGLLIDPQGDVLRIEAECETSGDEVLVRLRKAPAVATILPESIVRYVVRTHESVVLDEASSGGLFSSDPYILQNRIRSVLCLPLITQGKLTRVLYLENNLAARVFTSARTTVLKVIASQAAISLENTRLYRDLEDREAKIRRLFDANILGIFIWNLQGAIVEANEAFLSMLQYDRDDLAAGTLRWPDLTPSDSRERDEHALQELSRSGTVHPYEKEFYRKDKSRLPALVGAAAFDEQRDQGVAFVLDLTERKRAENALQLAKAELAHATRVTLLNALTASIAHEVNQPLAGIVINASTCLRMLDSDPPNVNGARETARRTLRDGNRASNVITRLRAMFSKKDITVEPLDLNEATREIIALSLSDLDRGRVNLRTDLASDLPLAIGDRVQLQQVILNMVRNGSEAITGIEDGPRELLIKTERDEGNQVRLSVRDSGVGFGPDAAAKLFEPFYTTKRDGMGIGLSISRSIIEAHRGRMWATANEGLGATFSFCIPSESMPEQN